MQTIEPRIQLAILAVIVVSVAAEMAWSHARKRGVYTAKETLANLAILLGMQGSKALFFGWQVLVLGFAGNWRLWDAGSGVLVFAVTFVAVDFLYYWQHRLLHESKPLWAFHVVHHSAVNMNLTTSFRLNWLSPAIGAFFYIPAVVAGAPVGYVGAAIGLNLLYQFWLHTTAIGRLGPLEGLINTPSAHRVHHGSNPEYLDRNYGGVLMIWDRLFGTYAEELVPVRYGITTGFVSNNPFVLVFHGFVDLFRGRLGSRG